MDNTIDNSHKLIYHATRGNSDEVERLIPVSFPDFEQAAALQLAASNGHVECVRLLIPVTTPNINI